VPESSLPAGPGSGAEIRLTYAELTTLIDEVVNALAKA
jgi:hypothetical protein